MVGEAVKDWFPPLIHHIHLPGLLRGLTLNVCCAFAPPKAIILPLGSFSYLASRGGAGTYHSPAALARWPGAGHRPHNRTWQPYLTLGKDPVDVPTKPSAQWASARLACPSPVLCLQTPTAWSPLLETIPGHRCHTQSQWDNQSAPACLEPRGHVTSAEPIKHFLPEFESEAELPTDQTLLVSIHSQSSS